ncbi:MAG TPA: hypothetical protein VLS25_00875 [Dehalococcoidia bacterium]|nr:hypothetical protein [Dehalococcoidia bacterium]
MKKALVVIGAVAALGVGLMVVGGAAAQGGPGHGRVQDFVSRLAGHLGISQDQLTTAVKDSEIDMINQAVADGKLTEDQAAKLKERVENGPVQFPGGGRDDLRRQIVCRAAGFVVDASATVLKTDTAALKSEFLTGKSLADVAQEKGMSIDDFKTKLTDQVKVDLQAKVDSGGITQKQMDRLFKAFTNHEDKIVNFHPKAGGQGICEDKDGGGTAAATPTPQP